jgi:NADPH2:quinone reductase
VKGLRFHAHGGPEVLIWDDVPAPEPAAGELLVEVAAFAVNWADLLERAGRYPGAPSPPYVTGHDLAGVVVGHGPGVDSPAIGTRVFGVIPRGGAAAELIAAPAEQFYLTPERVTDLEACGAAGPYLTADAAIMTMGRLAKDDDVLVHAAAGAYGSAAVQLARAYGAGRIIATAGTAEKAVRAKEWGADVVVDYTTEDFVAVVREATAGRGVDLVLESVGGDVLEHSFDCVRPGGHLVSVGASSGASTKRFRLQSLFELGISVSGFTLGRWIELNPELVAPSAERVLSMLGDGRVKPVIGRVFEAADVSSAHEFLAARQSVGRTVVSMSSAAEVS